MQKQNNKAYLKLNKDLAPVTSLWDNN